LKNHEKSIHLQAQEWLGFGQKKMAARATPEWLPPLRCARTTRQHPQKMFCKHWGKVFWDEKEGGMRYDGKKLAKPYNYSREHLPLANSPARRA